MGSEFVHFKWSLNLGDPVESMIIDVLSGFEGMRERREFLINAVLYYNRSPYLELVGGLKDMLEGITDSVQGDSLGGDLSVKLDGIGRKLDSFIEQVLLEVRSNKSGNQEDDRLFARLDKISKQIDSLGIKVSEQVVVREVVNNPVVDVDSADILLDDIKRDGMDKLFSGMQDKFGVQGDG